MKVAVTKELQPPGQRTMVGAGEILRALVHKELKVKYKRSILGFLWSLITPVALTGVYLFVFVYIYRVPQEDFILFLLTGMLPWQYFNMSLLASTTSIVDNAPLVRRMYFPRALLPASSVGANLINFLAGLGFLFVVLIISDRAIWTQLHWVLIALAMETALVLGASLTLSIANVYFRDIKQLISILLLVLFFGTPIVYDISLIPDAFRPLILANPLAPVMEVYRASLFRVEAPDLGIVALGLAEIAVVFGIGIFVFRRIGPRIAKEV